MPYAPAMKRLFRFLLWLAGVAVFLLATAHFTLRHLLNTPKFKTAATGFIERTTGRAADYGRIDYRLFPFALVVRDAVLREKGGAEEFASIQSFSAAVDFRNNEISSLRLERPSIRIVQRPDGTYNFSDLAPAAPEGKPAPATAAPGTPAPAAAPPAAATPTVAIRLVEIEKARFEFVRIDAEGLEEVFTLSNLDFLLRDFAADKPLQMEGRAAIGKSSAAQFKVSGPALADYAGRLGAWPVAFDAELDVRDFADLQAFLPAGTLPFPSLDAALNLRGALADKLNLQLKVKTPEESTEDFPVSLDAALRAEISLPAPVAQHLLAGDPLPEEFRCSPPPCAPPPGTISLAQNPELATLLRHAQAQATLSFPKIAYGKNAFEHGAATAFLRGGVLAIPDAKLGAYGGTVEARGNVQLLACPLSYRLERLAADRLALAQALAANGLGGFANMAGTLHLESSASGQAVAAPGLRSLAAEAKARIDDLQTVGTGGSLMDQVWLQLDNPLLLKLVPRLEPKVEQAKRAAATTTTSRYDEARATLVLRDGTATLSDARLALPDYRLDLAGALYPFDDRMDVAAHLVASPGETARLTDGKDLSGYLPYENGGLMVPLSIRGSLRSPRAAPDLDLLLKNALAGGTNAESGSILNELSDSDRKNVEKGLELLGTFLQP